MRGRGAVGNRLYEMLRPFPWAVKSYGDVHLCASFWYFAWCQHMRGAEDDNAGVRLRGIVDGSDVGFGPCFEASVP